MSKRARIYQPPKTAMQSGYAGTHHWRLEYEQSEAIRRDPLMGWAGSADTENQVRLHFDTLDEAVAYAEQLGIAYDLERPNQRRIQPKAYADNFRFGRKDNWDALSGFGLAPLAQLDRAIAF